MAILFDKKKVKLEHFENMVAIAHADGFFEEAEMKFLAEKAEEFGLSSQDVSNVIKNAAQLQFTVPKNQIDKEEQLADAVYMSLINGEVHSKEYEMCVHLAKKLELDQKEIDRIIEMITKLSKSTDSNGPNS